MMQQVQLVSMTSKPPFAAYITTNVTQLFEPGPDWSKAIGIWGLYWHIHTFVYAAIFVMIALEVVRSITVLVCGKSTSNRKLQMLLNTVILVVCFSRAFVLFADPYLQGSTLMEHTVTRLFWYLGEAGLVAGPCLLIIIVANSYTPKKVLNYSSFAVIITHYFVVIACVVTAEKYKEKQAIVTFRQAFFLFWGLFVAVNLFRLATMLSAKFKEIKLKRGKLLISLLYASGIIDVIMLVIFGYIAVTDLIDFTYPYTKYMDSWSWLAKQSALRLIEILLCEIVMAALAKHRKTHARMRRARLKEDLSTYGCYHSPNISVDDDFYSMSSSSSHNVTIKEKSHQSQHYNIIDFETYNFLLASHQSYGYGIYALQEQSQDNVNGNIQECNGVNFHKTLEVGSQENMTGATISNEVIEIIEEKNKGEDSDICQTENSCVGETETGKEVASVETATEVDRVGENTNKNC